MGEDIYTRMLFGQHARKVAFNYVVQSVGDNKALLIGNTVFASEMSFGASPDALHVLVLCDAVIRPHLVIESQHLAGSGIDHIARNGIADADEWLEHGRVIIDNMPKRRPR